MVAGVPGGDWSERDTLLRPWVAAGNRATFTNVMLPAGVFHFVVRAANETGGIREVISFEPVKVMQPQGGVSHGVVLKALAGANGSSQALLDVVVALLPEIGGTNPELAQLLFGTLLTIASNASAVSSLSNLGTIQRLGTTIRDAVKSLSRFEPSLLHLAATSLEHVAMASVDGLHSIANQLPQQATRDAWNSVLEGIHAVGLAYVNVTESSLTVGQRLVAATLGVTDKLVAGIQAVQGQRVVKIGVAGPGPMALTLSMATVSGEFAGAGINLFNGRVQLPAGAWQGRRLTSACSNIQSTQAEWHEYNPLHLAAGVGDGRLAVWPDAGLKVLEFKSCGKPLQLRTPARFALHLPPWEPTLGNAMPLCVVFNRTAAVWSRLGVTTEVSDLQRRLLWCQSLHDSGAYAVAAGLPPHNNSAGSVVNTTSSAPASSNTGSHESPDSFFGSKDVGIYVASLSSAGFFLVCVGVACGCGCNRFMQRRRIGKACQAKWCLDNEEETSDMDEGMDEHFGGSDDLDDAIAERENEVVAAFPRSTMFIRKPFGAPDTSSSFDESLRDSVEEWDNARERWERDRQDAFEDTEFTKFEDCSVELAMESQSPTPRVNLHVDVDEVCAGRAAGSGMPTFLVRGNRNLPNPAGDMDGHEAERRKMQKAFPPGVRHAALDNPSITPPPSPRFR